MGFYIRKSFKAGPVRLNLSKRGLGTSLGVKGLRLGASASGRTYVHAGRGGLYYRKNLSSKKQPSAQKGIGFGSIILFVFVVIIIFKIFKWLAENPVVPITVGSLAVMVIIVYFYNKARKSKTIEKYKTAIDRYFVTSSVAPEHETINEIMALRKKANKYSINVSKIIEIEQNVYSAILDKIIDDKKITDEERDLIKGFESICAIDEEFKKETKKEIFRLLYMDCIADHEITKEELDTLNNYIYQLDINKSEVKDELNTVQEILRTQKLALPLKPVQNSGKIKIQKKETPYYSGTAKVLTRKKAKRASASEYEYSVRKEGQFIITDKRLLIVSEGTTTIRLKDILDIDVDLDQCMIVISKWNSSTPLFIKNNEPLYAAKILDLLT